MLFVHLTKLYRLIPHPTSIKNHVGRCAIAVSLDSLKKQKSNKKDDPLHPDDVGTIDYMAARGKQVQLIPVEGRLVHEDGKTGEVYLRTFSTRKKTKESFLPRTYALQLA